MTTQNTLATAPDATQWCGAAQCICKVLPMVIVAVGVFVSGCDHDVRATKMTKKLAGKEINVLFSCQTTDELKLYYATDSQGGNVHIEERSSLVFVQTFPYSGVRASHLYVYIKDEDWLRFVCFFRVQTQDNVGLRLNDDGTIEIRTDDKNVATLDPDEL